MKRLVYYLLKAYKILISPLLTALFGNACVYKETCSDFAQRKVLEEGVFKGLLKGIKRISTCHPYSKRYTNQVYN